VWADNTFNKNQATLTLAQHTLNGTGLYTWAVEAYQIVLNGTDLYGYHEINITVNNQASVIPEIVLSSVGGAMIGVGYQRDASFGCISSI
jgi:hypothetical protein